MYIEELEDIIAPDMDDAEHAALGFVAGLGLMLAIVAIC